MNINDEDEVVEAAAKASFEFMEDMEWGLANFLDKELFRDAARCTLIAAAPHLMAQALEDAAEHVLAPGASSLAADWLRARADEYRSAGAGL